MTHRKIAVVTAGLTQPSSTRLLGDRLAAATRDALDRNGVSAEVTTIELRDHDLTNHLLTGYPTDDLREAIDSVVGADGLIAVTPTFSASYNACSRCSSTSSRTGRWPASRC